LDLIGQIFMLPQRKSRQIGTKIASHMLLMDLTRCQASAEDVRSLGPHNAIELEPLLSTVASQLKISFTSISTGRRDNRLFPWINAQISEI